jgi:cytochrome P450
MADERHQFTTISDKYTEERMELLKQGNFNRKDVMSALLDASDPKTGEKLTEAETWSEAHLMIAAG